MSGIPVEVLVDIGDSHTCFTFGNSGAYERPHTEDDPFEICSKQQNILEKDLGLELGLALEKSIKLHSSQSGQENSLSEIPQTTQMNLGILVNLEESPDKKSSAIVSNIRQNQARDSDTVFVNASTNPFELAWDVIQKEALNLADHILKDKEKQISPRKMVELAMKLSPDSLLLSPCNNKKDEEILINSSPELEMKKTPKLTQFPKVRPSLGSSPLVTRAYATPLRNRTRLSINASPSFNHAKVTSASPSKSSIFRGAPVKPPLLRSSSAMAPLGNVSVTKTLSAKAVPLKATHPPSCQLGKPKTKATTQNTSQLETPIRRGFASQTETPMIAPKYNFLLKSRTISSRHEPQTGSNKPNDTQRSNATRTLRRSSVAHQSNNPNNSKTLLSGDRLSTGHIRAKLKGRENTAS